MPVPDPEQEPEELIRFREDWRKELEAKRAHPPGPSHDVDHASTIHADTVSQPSLNHVQSQPGPSSQTIAGAPTPSSLHLSHGITKLTRGLGTAIETYRRAVQYEQQSQLDDALRLYRRAFRMDPNVDKAYHTAEQYMATDAAGPGAAHGHTRKKSNSLTLAVDELARGASSLSGKHTGSGGRIVTGTLANLLENFPRDLFFEPEDERQGVPLNSLPDEMIVLILRSLDHTTIERFAAVNRKARLISLDSAIWRDFVEMTYIPPQILHAMEADIIAESYLSDYRRMYIEHPRLRLDGVYIAVCHYVRPGLSENAWVKINHLITYHRYLRFFPDGQVLSLLANEELGPQQVIPLLKPTLRMKGLFIGEWQLDDTTVYITNLLDASGKLSLPLPTSQSSPSVLMHPSSATATTTSYSTRYAFQMTLGLRSRPLGRWNKLDFEAYDSVDLESGETIPLNLKHERAFWFSKVRSYTA